MPELVFSGWIQLVEKFGGQVPQTASGYITEDLMAQKKVKLDATFHVKTKVAEVCSF